MDNEGVAEMTSELGRSTHGGYPLSVPPTGASPDFLLWREVDRLERAIEVQSRRMEYLDEHGSRGVDSLRGQIEQIRKDLLDHEGLHTEAARQARDAAQQAVTARRWMIGVIIALVTPLYPLILFIIFGWKG